MPAIALQVVLKGLIAESEPLWRQAIAYVHHHPRERSEGAVLRIYTGYVEAYLQEKGYTFVDVADDLSRRQDHLGSALAYHRTHFSKKSGKVPIHEQRSHSSVPLQSASKETESLFDKIGGVTETMLNDPKLLKKYLIRIMPELHPDRHRGHSSAKYQAVKALWDMIAVNGVDGYKRQLRTAGIPLLSTKDVAIDSEMPVSDPASRKPRERSEVPVQSTRSAGPPEIDANVVAADILAHWSPIWTGMLEQARAEGDETKAQERFAEVLSVLYCGEVSLQAVRGTPRMAEYMRLNPQMPLTRALRPPPPPRPRGPDAEAVAVEVLQTWEHMWSGIRKQAITEGFFAKAQERFVSAIDIVLELGKVSPQMIKATPQMDDYMRSNPHSPLTTALQTLSATVSHGLNKPGMQKLRKEQGISADENKDPKSNSRRHH